MEKIIKALDVLQEINKAYNISTETAERLNRSAAEAAVCTPIIGKFSSGKSALVNALLGYRNMLLKQDIVPQTAVPTEIIYADGEETVTVTDNDGSSRNISVDEYRETEADASTVQSVRLRLRNSFLEKIPDVMLVDMPGFDSGMEIHDRAIDSYVSHSLAYIITFSVDEMIVKDTIGNILKELCLHDMPLCVVITKCDKKNDDFEITFAKMKEYLKRYIGDREIKYCQTSSALGEVDELKEFLGEIQERSQIILHNGYVGRVLAIADNTRNYLETTLSSVQLSESELEEQEEKLHKQISDINSKFANEKVDFELEIKDCVEEIKGDLRQALEAREAEIAEKILNGGDVNGYISNGIVRSTVVTSVKNRLIPRVEKYLKRMADFISSEEFGDVHINLYIDTEKVGNEITVSTAAAAAAILISPVIVGIFAGVMAIINKIKSEKRRAETRMKVRTEVIPQVLEEVGRHVEMEIAKQIRIVNTNIEDEFKAQQESLEKAMDDVRNRRNDEKQQKDDLIGRIKADLDRISEIKNGLR